MSTEHMRLTQDARRVNKRIKRLRRALDKRVEQRAQAIRVAAQREARRA